MSVFDRVRRWNVFALLVAVLAIGFEPAASWSAQDGDRIAKHLTVNSIQDPIPGHAQHQVAILLPPANGTIYTGTVSYTASIPVEVVVFHAYEPVKDAHGSVLVGTIGDKPYAISVMQFSNDVPVTNSATVNFTGSAMALHTLNGKPFTATVTVDAVRRTLTP